MEPYNAVLYMHSAMDHCDLSVLIDNDALYHQCSTRLDLDGPSFADVNHLVAQMVSAATVSMRFSHHTSYPLNVDLREMQTNLVPFPRIRHLLTTLTPIVSPERVRSRSQGQCSVD